MKQNKQFIILAFLVLFIFMAFVPMSSSSTIEDKMGPNDSYPVEVQTLSADGDEWLLGWKYRQKHLITGQVGVSTDYQMRFSMEYDSGSSSGYTVDCEGHCQTDFGDLRFTDGDGDTLLDYWIEEYTAGGDGTVWVEVKDSLGTDRNIYVYYGTVGTTSTTSSGANTFDFFDDFNRANSDTVGNGWTDDAGNGDNDIDTNRLEIVQHESEYAHIEKAAPAMSTMSVQVKVYLGDDAGGSWHIGLGVYWGSYDYLKIQPRESLDRWYGFQHYSSTGQDYNYAAATCDYSIWYWIRIRVTASTSYFDYSTDGVSWTNAYNVGRHADLAGNPSLIIVGKGYEHDTYSNANWDNDYGTAGAEGTSYNDDVFARKYFGAEPTHSTWWAEESNPVPTNDATPTIATLDDTDNMYSYYRSYEVTTYHSDTNGFDDISWASLSFWKDDQSEQYMILKFDQDIHVFSESGSDAQKSYVELDVGGSSYSEHDTDELDIKWRFKITWLYPDLSNIDVACYIKDTVNGENHDFYESVWDIETRLEFDTEPIITSDDSGGTHRGDLNEAFHVTGDISYLSSALIPLSSSVDVLVAMTAGGYGSNEGPWEDDTVPAGAFDVTCYADNEVGEETYGVKVVNEGDAYGDANLITAGVSSETYIADQMEVYYCNASSTRVSINANAHPFFRLRLKYDNHLVDVSAFDTVHINGSSATWDVGESVWYKSYSQSTVGSWNFIVTSASEYTYGVTGVNSASAVTYDKDIIWDRVNITLVPNIGWAVIGYNVTLSATGVFEHDDTSWSGAVTWVDQYPSEATANTYNYGLSSVTSITDPTHGITVFQVGESASVIFDDAEVSSTAYYWVQYSVDSVWVILQTGTWTWTINGTTIDTGADTVCVLQSEMNNTDDDWGIVDSTGRIGDLIIGQFDSDWYYVKIDINCEITVDGNAYDWEVWTITLDVDIMHSIHIEDSGMNIQDNWITFYFHTNWNNATFYIWDNSSLVGSSLEGWYQIAKPTAVGLHNYTILVNGTQDTITDGEQNKDFSVSDSWEWLNFKYTVNPVTLSITDLLVQQNNISIVLSGFINTPSLSMTWEAFEHGVSIDTGSFTIPASGDYYAIYWAKATPALLKNFTLTITAGGNSISVYGYSFVIDGSSYVNTYNAASHFDGDEVNNIYPDTGTTAFWFTMQAILLIIVIPVIIGIVYYATLARRGKRGKQDHLTDAYRTPP